MPPLGFIHVWSDSPHYEFTCLLGDTVPTPTAGYQGWQIVPRARRRGLTEFMGNPPLQYDIGLMFDDFAAGSSMEKFVRQLEKMAGLERGLREPPLVKWDTGGAVAHDYTNDSSLDWVIFDIKWGDAERNVDGHRTRQACTVTFTNYVEDDNLANQTSAGRRRLGKELLAQKKGKRLQSGALHRYVVNNSRETLESIAAKPTRSGGLGRSSRWHEIKRLNPQIRDPKMVIQPGTVLRMP